jgi:hypothetical protein
MLLLTVGLSRRLLAGDDVLVQEMGWRTDRVRDADEVVRWRPAVRVSSASGTWAGASEDGRWVVGRPGRHVLRADSRPGVVALLPLLERPAAEVAAELGVESLDGHGLGFADVVGVALSWRGSAYWTEKAIAWLDTGFPAAGHQDGLRRVLAEKRVGQRARQVAARILARESPGPVSLAESPRTPPGLRGT